MKKIDKVKVGRNSLQKDKKLSFMIQLPAKRIQKETNKLN